MNLEGEIEPVEAFTQRKSGSARKASRPFKKEIDELALGGEKPPNDIFRIKSCHRRHGSIA